MPILKVQELTKTFGTFTAVDHISFALDKGEILGFLGTNGAGKTTTLQMLLGVLTPTSGTVSYFNQELTTHRQQILEKVNFSSTYTSLPGDLTVFESLTFISYLYRIPNRSKRVREIIDTFQLGSMASQKVMTLSAGQKTKLNLAKSFLNKPSVLLLDEPTASLDPDIAADVRKLLREQQQSSNISVLITSHNMAEVEEICDRILFIHHGKIVANDTPEHLTKTLDICHVELLIDGDPKKLRSHLKQHKLEATITDRRVRMDIRETQLAQMLQGLGAAGIVYHEISIEKPTLEDYFLHVVKDKRTL